MPERGSHKWRSIGPECSFEVNVEVSCSMIREVNQIEGVEAVVMDPGEKRLGCHCLIYSFRTSSICDKVSGVGMKMLVDISKIVLRTDRDESGKICA